MTSDWMVVGTVGHRAFAGNGQVAKRWLMNGAWSDEAPSALGSLLHAPFKPAHDGATSGFGFCHVWRFGDVCSARSEYFLVLKPTRTMGDGGGEIKDFGHYTRAGGSRIAPVMVVTMPFRVFSSVFCQGLGRRSLVWLTRRA